MKTKRKESKSSASCAHIVGIGGSAGALEACKEFFAELSPDTQMGFVFVMHLDPTHPGMMPEILGRLTKMKVSQAEEGTKVQPRCVYVIPPNKDLSLVHGTLHLLEQSTPRGLRMPIDFFFKQLAEDQQDKSIGIILSGMGSDGTLGLKAIKEKLGLVMVQEPRSAKHDLMPRSAIGTGLVDVVAPATELSKKLLQYVEHFKKLTQRSAVEMLKPGDALPQILALLRTRTGNDFSLYKTNTIYRRIEKRMGVLQIDKLTGYFHYLQKDPQEIDVLFKELLIRVTKFFRDPSAFDHLKEQAILALLKDTPAGSPVRVWVPGCSTGEEAYSLAILLQEGLDKLKRQRDLQFQIFATDIDQEAITKARAGVYPLNIAAEVSTERLERFFEKEDNVYRVNKETRKRVIFAPHNVIQDPPFSKMNLVSCRNLLIYLMVEAQNKLLMSFHRSLKDGGILFLGSSESLGDASNLFLPVDNKWKIFKWKKTAFSARGNFPSFLLPAGVKPAQRTAPLPHKMKENFGDAAREILLQAFAPASVLVSDLGEILYFHGRTGKYLEQPSGKAVTNLFAMARAGLGAELRILVRQALTQKREMRLPDVRIKMDGGVQIINLTVKPLKSPEPVRGLLLVAFEDVVPAKGTPPRKAKPVLLLKKGDVIQKLEDEVEETRERLQATLEEMGTSLEELQSLNEELQSTNEELSATSEELESSNEELLTVNAELQMKVDELNQSNATIKNLFDSTEVATLFLDRDLKLKLFTPPATKIMNLIATDLGRPISHIVSNLQYKSFIPDVEKVLKTLAPKTAQVQATEGRWYLMNITPYRTAAEVVEGTVITFTNITVVKQLEESLRASEVAKAVLSYAESIVETIREPLLVLDKALRVKSANRSFYQTFQAKKEETENHLIYELGNGQWKIPKLRTLLEEILTKNTEFQDFAVEHKFQTIGTKTMLLNARRLRLLVEDKQTELILLAIEDITEGKRLEEKYQRLLEAAPDAIVILNKEGRIEIVNRRTEEMFGYSRDELLANSIEFLFSERFREQYREYRRKYLSNPSVMVNTSLELEGLRKDGSGFPVEVMTQMQEEELLLMTIRDITERKQIEKTKAELAAVEARAPLAAIVESSEDAIIGETLDGIITSWNKGAEHLYGYTTQEVIGMPGALLVPLGQQDEIPQFLERIKRGEKIEHYETQRRAKNDTLVDVSLTLSPIQGPQGEIVGASAIARDISLQKRTEENLKRFSEELARSNKELEQFAYVVSHDLKAPLRGINLLSQWIVEDFGKRLEKEGLENLRKLQDRVLRMGTLINGILQYSRIGRIREAIREINLLKLVEETLELINPPPHIKIKIDKNLPAVKGEKVRLQQLFQNLLSNACRYANPEKGEVRIECSEKKDHWEFRISDNGPGIAKKHHKRIFQMFQTLEPEGKGGTGIGLSIAKKIITLNGGQIRVDSEPGRGAAFIFTLPREIK